MAVVRRIGGASSKGQNMKTMLRLQVGVLVTGVSMVTVACAAAPHTVLSEGNSHPVNVQAVSAATARLSLSHKKPRPRPHASHTPAHHHPVPTSAPPTRGTPTSAPTSGNPTPASGPPPTRTSSGGANCSGAANTPGGADPWGGCWPGPDNTGPVGVSLEPYNGVVRSDGSCVITTNTVIDGKTMACQIIVNSGNLTLENSSVSGEVY